MVPDASKCPWRPNEFLFLRHSISAFHVTLFRRHLAHPFSCDITKRKESVHAKRPFVGEIHAGQIQSQIVRGLHTIRPCFPIKIPRHPLVAETQFPRGARSI